MIKRKIYKIVVDAMNDYSIPIIVGYRRTGKTTLLMQLQEEFTNSVYLTMDDFDLRIKTEGQLLTMFKEYIANGIDTFFIDEIQKLKNWDVILKQLFDKYMYNKKIKMAVTGSSILSFTKRETGVDRTTKIVLGTLSYIEYLEITKKEDSYDTFEEFLTYGGFPGYLDKKRDTSFLLNKTLMPVLDDDIPKYYKYEDSGLISIVEELSTLSNGEFNKDKSSKNTGMSTKTIEGYLNALEKSMIIKRVYCLRQDGNVGRYPKFKVYLNPHFHVWLQRKPFSNIDPKHVGHIIESYYIFNMMQGDNYYSKFFYYKDNMNNEIDFVVPSTDNEFLFEKAIEFKYVSKASKEIVTNLSNVSAKTKIVYCKEDFKDGLITFKSIKDI